eukprot:CAMPEP_0175131534 /NCGR_PEP_ID=MMETSP0087-20121206/6594_1 /TAXON_ID=136419 /ORGANISM="Unknown Unknown, Strain D1" /LENGTH=227 /DNA_ID=CAMNT_0016413831 /DNA_START=519 /DNA_END=1202 /DNA_ORIENTATION=+
MIPMKKPAWAPCLYRLASTDTAPVSQARRINVLVRLTNRVQATASWLAKVGVEGGATDGLSVTSTVTTSLATFLIGGLDDVVGGYLLPLRGIQLLGRKLVVQNFWEEQEHQEYQDHAVAHRDKARQTVVVVHLQSLSVEVSRQSGRQGGAESDTHPRNSVVDQENRSRFFLYEKLLDRVVDEDDDHSVADADDELADAHPWGKNSVGAQQHPHVGAQHHPQTTKKLT